MTKLPDDSTLIGFFREGLSNRQIAEAYDVTVSAVDWRFSNLGIQRKPHSRTAAAILNAAFPSSEFKRTGYTQRSLARGLILFLRWRLGDELSPEQERRAKQMVQRAAEKNSVLHLDVTQEQTPWVWLPREPEDGCLILRWPEGREKPKGAHLKALMVHDCDNSECDATAKVGSS